MESILFTDGYKTRAPVVRQSANAIPLLEYINRPHHKTSLAPRGVPIQK
jgi:hypothetical protein